MAGGTKVADVYVDLGLALTEYRKGLAQAKKEGLSIGGQIRAALSQPAGGTGAYTSGFARLIRDIRAGKPALDAFRANLPAVANDLKKLSVSGLHAGLNALEGTGKRVFGGLRSLAGNVFKGIALGAGVSAFFGVEQIVSRLVSAFPELINKGKEWAEAIHTITLETGASAESASKQAAIYRYLGGSTDQYGTQVVRLAARIKANKDELHKYGVVTENANGDLLDQITLVDNLRKVFALLPDGPNKTAIAFKLFGQRGAQAFGPLIHFLGLTDEQVKALGADVEAQGLVLTDAQIKLGDETEKAQNRVGNAITGLATKLFTVLGPGITSFFDGLAETITANAQQIVDALGSMATAVLGFVEGLIGVKPALDSFSTQFPRINEGGANTSATLVGLQDQLQKLKDKLNPATDAAGRLNARIDAGVKALDREGVAIDKQIAKLNRIGDARDTNFKRGLESLTRALDLENQLFDAEDKATARADRDLANTRALRDAKVALFEAQAQLRQDELDNAKISDPSKRKSTDQDALAIAKAQQGVLDAQKQISDETRNRAEEDRRAQIGGVKDYVAAIQKIVEDSENKKAALNTLTKRKAKLEDEIAAATEIGNAQAVADLKVKLGAVDAGITEENSKIKQAAAIDELTARKNQLADEKAALQAERTSEGAINRAATKVAIAAKEEEIKKERERIAEARKNRAAEIKDAKLFSTAITGPGGLTGAYEEARLKGVAFATDVHDALVGKDGNGGVLGAVRSIAGAFGDIKKTLDGIASSDVWKLLNQPIGVPGSVGPNALPNGANDIGNNFWKGFYKAFGFLPEGVTIYESSARPSDERPGRTRDAGGWVGSGLWRNQGPPEYVLDNRLSRQLQHVLDSGQMPTMAGIGGMSGTLIIEHMSIELGGKPVLDYFDKQFGFRSRR